MVLLSLNVATSLQRLLVLVLVKWWERTIGKHVFFYFFLFDLLTI